MAQRNVERLASSPRHIREFVLPTFPVLSERAVTGDPRQRAIEIQKFNIETQQWRNNAQQLLEQWWVVVKTASDA